MDTSTRKKVVVAFAALAAGLGFVVVSKGFAAPPPGAGYRWAQPGCATVTTPYAQPPASVAAVPATVVTPAVGSGYAWAQPGCAPATTPYAQPPALVAAVPATVVTPAVGSGYAWAQPGCAPVATPGAQPPTG